MWWVVCMRRGVRRNSTITMSLKMSLQMGQVYLFVSSDLHIPFKSLLSLLFFGLVLFLRTFFVRRGRGGDKRKGSDFLFSSTSLTLKRGIASGY